MIRYKAATGYSERSAENDIGLYNVLRKPQDHLLSRKMSQVLKAWVEINIILVFWSKTISEDFSSGCTRYLQPLAVAVFTGEAGRGMFISLVAGTLKPTLVFNVILTF